MFKKTSSDSFGSPESGVGRGGGPVYSGTLKGPGLLHSGVSDVRQGEPLTLTLTRRVTGPAFTAQYINTHESFLVKAIKEHSGGW